MTAVDVRVERVEVVPVRVPARIGPAYEAALVSLHGEGLVGLGEAPALPERGAGLAALVRELESGEPASPAARCALETARLDLQARAAGVSLARLLAERPWPSVNCNALVSAERPAEVAAEVETLAGRGFWVFKLKARSRGGTADRERLGAARFAGGQRARLRLDFNGLLGPAQALAALTGLEEFGLELVEQPLPAAAPVADWTRLQARVPVTLAADESLALPALAEDLAGLGIVLAVKLATVGGPAAALRLARLARGPVLIASSYESGVGLAAALHTACALPAAPPACGLATLDRLDSGLVSGAVPDGPRLRLPDTPGLGVELDREAVARYRLDK